MQCGFKQTKINLDLLTDYDMLLMFETGIRGGYSGVLGDRYVKANNKYVPLHSTKLTTRSEDTNNKLDKLDISTKWQQCPSTKRCQSNYLLYLHANNLYGL